MAERPHSIAVDSLLARQLGSELADSLAASGGDRLRPSGIANRLSCLEGAQANWRNRVGEKDVRQFTVEGKLSAAGEWSVTACVVTNTTRCSNNSSYNAVVMIVGCTLLLWYLFRICIFRYHLYISVQVSIVFSFFIS